MASVRRLIVGVLATLLVGIAAPAHAQPGRGTGWAATGIQVDEFDVEQVPRLTAGTPLNFSLYGTPGAAVSLQIDGARRSLDLQEVQPGFYEGTYIIDPQDRIRPQGHVTATLRRGNQVARSVLEEALQLGGGASATAASAPMDARPPMDALPPIAAEPSIDAGSPLPSRPSIARPAPDDEGRSTAAVTRLGRPVPTVPPSALACADCAVVESVRVVEVPGEPGVVGAFAGGVVGAIFGQQIGDAHARRVARVLGAIGGIFAGREVERQASRRVRHDVLLRLPDGGAQIRSYDSAPPFRVGDTVRLDAATLVRAERSAAPL